MPSIALLNRLAAPLASRPLWLAILFVVAALLGGGAGIGYPLIETVIELLAIVLIARAGMAAGRARQPWQVYAILAVFGAAAALALAQCIPLPPAQWRALPGRATATALYDAIGWGARWHPASLTPDRTLLDLLALLPALAGFVTVAGLPERGRAVLLRTVVVVALFAALFGAIQVASGAQGAPMPFATIHRGFGIGFFVNRNHQAAFQLVAMLLAAVPGVVTLGRKGRGAALRPDRRAMTLGIVAFLALGVLATTSRTGLVLLPLALIVAAGMVFDLRSGSGWGRFALPAAIAAYAVAGAALYPTPLVQQTLARLAVAGEDLRYQYWANTRFAIDEAMPWGTGFGSFDTVYRSIEPLAHVAPPWINHAHNDYLELALEGGVPAIVLLVVAMGVAIAAFGHAWWRAPSSATRTMVIAGATGVTLLLLCSVVDFPLRMAAIGVVFGMLLGLVVPPVRQSAVAAMAEDARARPLRVVASGAAGLAVGWLSLSGGLAVFLAQQGIPAPATVIAPWFAGGWSQLANLEQVVGRPTDSAAAARRALEIAPLDADAVRALGFAELAQRHGARGDALLQLGAALGWRDTVMQLWLVKRALQVGALPVAVERIDGLLRRGVQQDVMQRQLRAIFVYPGGETAIVARLGEHPPWRQGFLNAIADDAPQAVPQLFALLQDLRRAGMPATSEETALIRWRLADAGNFAAARAVWLGSGGLGLIGDGAFERSSGVVPPGAAPFVWRAPRRSGVHLTIIEPDTSADAGTGVGGPAGRSLMIASDGYAAGPVLAQTIVLSPGEYRFGASLRTPAGGRVPQVAWSIACFTPGGQGQPFPIRLASAPSMQGWMRVTGAFTIPAGCPGQSLALTLPESAGQPVTLQVDAVRLAPFGGGGEAIAAPRGLTANTH